MKGFRRSVNDRTQVFILLLFGGALTRLATTDALLRYVRPSARRWVLLAGIAILALSLWNLAATLHPREAADRDTGELELESGQDAHGHSTTTRVVWLVMGPVLAILVIAPPALGSFSAARATATVPQPARVDFPQLSKGNPAPISVLDFATRAIWDDGRTLVGHPVRVTGFVLARNAEGFILTRLVITCCAADAQPVNVQVIDPSAAFAVNSWTEVTGTYAGVSASEKTLPVLRADTVTPVREPANPYDD